MFQSSNSRVRAWLNRAEELLGRVDILGDPPAAAPPHPHRQPLRSRRDRRPGAVAARPADCISPVRANAGARERAARP